MYKSALKQPLTLNLNVINLRPVDQPLGRREYMITLWNAMGENPTKNPKCENHQKTTNNLAIKGKMNNRSLGIKQHLSNIYLLNLTH